MDEWVTHHVFGHPVYLDGYDLRYCDTHEVVDWANKRPCPKCGQLPTPEGHDPCIANLPGVRAACCGHGLAGYVLFEDFRIIEFPQAKMGELGPKWDARWRIVAALKGRASPVS